MAEVVSKRSIVYEILVDDKQAKTSIKDTEKSMKSLDKTASTIDATFLKAGAAIAGAFAVEKLISFTKEAVQLADKAEKIKRAFDKLNDPKLLSQLREATAGALSDMELMSNAVKAARFKVPLSDLANMFKFATMRAKETGEEVNSLIDALVEGLGGGSTRAFKALGISASDFAKEVKKAGSTTKALSNIIEKEFKRSGDSVNDFVDAGDKLNASITNFKVTIGSLINDGFLEDFQDFFADVINLANDAITGQKAYNEELERTGKIIKKFTEEDIVNLISGTEVILEIQKQQAEQGRQLTEIEIQAITDAAKARAKAVVESAREIEQTVEETTDKLSKFKLGDVADTGLNLPLEKSIGLIGDIEAKIAKLESQKPFAKTQEQVDSLNIQIALLRSQLADITEPKELTTGDGSQPENDALDLNNQLTEANIALKEQQIEAAQALFDIGADLLEQNSALGVGFAIFSKGLAIADVIIKLQGTLAGLQLGASAWLANPATTAVATALLAAQSARAKIQAGVQIATIAATAIPQFAEGTEYLDHPKAPHGVDTILIRGNRGEAIIPTEENLKAPGLAAAWINGNLEDYINVNYVSPALAAKTIHEIEKDSALDYSNRFYKQLLATAEGNQINKKALKYLNSIDVKLGKNIPSRYA